MDFLPMPHRVTPGEGAFTLTWRTRIVLENTEPSALLYAQMLQKDIGDATGIHIALLRGVHEAGDIVLMPDESLDAQTYRLHLDEHGVQIRGGSDEALLHGVMTLRQWILRHGALLPAMDVEDWPDLPHRGYYLDCSRGRIPTLETLKRYADLLCRYKINEWQLYVEHTYLFRNLSEAWREDTPLTAQEIMELDAYCRARHIELVPSLSSFGHMYQILSTKTCCEYCELPDSEKQPFTYTYWGDHHTLNVSHPGTMDFIKGLIDEYRALFTSRKFNICCDETFDLCKGRSAHLAEQSSDIHALYMAHVAELCRYLLSQGITPMFWGDIVYRVPESYRLLPDGVICLNWGYLPNQRPNEIQALAEMGATQYACPGVCTWNQWLPLMKNSFDNNRVMCRHAHQYGAIGLLNTDWGDYGHVCYPWFSVPGILYGAGFSWNAEERSFEEVNQAISVLEYGDRTGSFVSAMAALTGHEVLGWGRAVRWIECQDNEKRRTIFHNADLLDVAATAAAANERIDQALVLLAKAAPNVAQEKRSIIGALALHAEGVKLWNEIGLYVAFREDGAQIPHRDGAVLACELERWYHAILEEWRSVSKEGLVHRTLSIICAWADYLRKRNG